MSNAPIVHVDPDLEDLIPGFLENRHKDVEAIRTLLGQGNWSEIQRLGHSMKGAGGGYGFDEISEIGKELEEAAKRGDTDAVNRLNQQLQSYLDQVQIVYREEE